LKTKNVSRYLAIKV